MNKSIINQTFPAYRYLTGEVVVLDPVEIGDRLSAEDQVLDVIFAPDPFTRLPQNDIALYMSPKVPQEIRDFIGSNLMSPVPKSDGIPDEYSDVLHDLVRGANESVSDYAVRVRGIVEQDSITRQKAADIKPVEPVDVVPSSSND